MKKSEKIAIGRILYDLIKADAIIDSGEMRHYALMKEKYNIGKEEEIAACQITFAEAVNSLDSSDLDFRDAFIRDCIDMTVSDGFCARSEALLMIALKKVLANSEDASILSIPKNIFDVASASILYVESKENICIDQIIQSNYRTLLKESQVAGFDFIYIPKVIEHYRETDKTLAAQIIQFLEPSLSNEEVHNILHGLLSMTTRSFCKDILCNKLGISALRDSDPAILIKVGHSYVGENIYSNYLKIEIDKNLVQTLQELFDTFLSMFSADAITISTVEESDSQFLYHGFYKQLLDIFLVKRNIRSKVVINPLREEIIFPDIDKKLSSLHRKEKAFYVLMLILSQHGGVNFNLPLGPKQLATYNKHMRNLQLQYQLVYGQFGGDKAPDITQPEIRRPMLSRIKKGLSQLEGILYNINDYYVLKDEYGTFRVGIEIDSLFVYETDRGNVPMCNSKIYIRVCNLRI